jgi:hypothetical protein
LRQLLNYGRLNQQTGGITFATCNTFVSRNAAQQIFQVALRADLIFASRRPGYG